MLWYELAIPQTETAARQGLALGAWERLESWSQHSTAAEL